MYIAEIKGKLSSKNENKEDILTSNVFSFFKYSDRQLYLKKYLNSLGLNISSEAADNAEFIFWPKLHKGTEPDVIIIVGDYYILIEAKLFSEFSKETKNIKSQILREIECGLLESKNYEKKFKMIAINADYYYKKSEFNIIPIENKSDFIWTNWQFISNFLITIIDQFKSDIFHNKLLATDLCDLLIKKKLIEYRGYNALPQIKLKSLYDNVFFNYTKSKFRGQFIGFQKSLSNIKKLNKGIAHIKILVYKTFSSLYKAKKLINFENKIFLQGENYVKQN